MIFTARLKRKGQLTLPLEIRKDLDLDENDVIAFQKQGNQYVLVRPGELARRTAGSLAKYAHNYPDLQPHEVSELAAQAIADDFMRSMDDKG